MWEHGRGHLFSLQCTVGRKRENLVALRFEGQIGFVQRTGCQKRFPSQENSKARARRRERRCVWRGVVNRQVGVDDGTRPLQQKPLCYWPSFPYIPPSFTTSFPVYAHCSFLFGQPDPPFYEEPLGLWQVPLGHHPSHSAHPLPLDSGGRGLHANKRELRQVCLTASLHFPASGFLQSSENVPSQIQEQPEWQGSLPSWGPPLKYGKEDSVGPWPRVSFFGGRLPHAGGCNLSATVVTTPVAHPLFITLVVVGLSFSPLSLHLYFNPVSWDHLPNKLSAIEILVAETQTDMWHTAQSQLRFP